MIPFNIISVNKKVPKWVDQAFNEYVKRLPKDFALNITDVPTVNRNNNSVKNALKIEAEKIEKKIKKDSFIVTLEIDGKNLSTEKLAKNIKEWRKENKFIQFVIGGPDGIDSSISKKSNFKWSLSNLTFPHSMVRVMLAEQIYRAWTLLNNHPYHHG